MSQPSVIYWPPADGPGFVDAIVQNQVLVPVGQNVPLQANIPGVSNVYQFDKVIRSINIKSVDDLSAVYFVVSGIGTPVDPADGNPTSILQPLTETIQGVVPPGVASSANIYSQINSITIRNNAGDADATNFKIGFGAFGITDYVFFDYNRTAAALSSASLQFINHAVMSAGVYISLNKPETPNISNGVALEPFGIETLPTITFIPAFPVQGVTAPTTTDSIGSFIGAFSVVWATVLGTTTDSMYFTFVQPGIA